MLNKALTDREQQLVDGARHQRDVIQWGRAWRTGFAAGCFFMAILAYAVSRL